MTVDFTNVYDDRTRAEAYAALEFPGTYYLAFRDLPKIIHEHVRGTKALDFGCGTGRSTRFLRQLGFDTIGVDIAAPMLARARVRDPQGDYRLVPAGDLTGLPADTYDLILSAFTFDNIPTLEKKVTLLTDLKQFLTPSGILVNLVSTPEIYHNEWASFSTRNFPQNRTARTGDKVWIVMLDVADARPVEDILWTDQGYQKVFQQSGFVPLRTYRPLGDQADAIPWVSEMTIAPWVIYALALA